MEHYVGQDVSLSLTPRPELENSQGQKDTFPGRSEHR
jgi:hypothetical protein